MSAPRLPGRAAALSAAAARYYHAVRYLRPWQVAGRLLAAPRRRLALLRLPEPPANLRGALAPAVPVPAHDPWNDADELRAGRFCFLNRAEALSRPVDWHAPHLPLLWRFNLHYFQYLHLLGSEEQAALCREWVAANPVGAGVGWHAYPTSLRIVNWCRAGLDAPDLAASLYRQAAFLYRNLETQVQGNHLLENARALVFAGRYFDGQGEADAWLRRGLDLYREEAREQVLPDGGHYERSPMYHALMLEGFTDVVNLLPADHPDRSWLVEIIRRMIDVLATTTHPDGNLALFNDATHDIALPPSALAAYVRAVTGCEGQPLAALPDTGYYTHRDENVFLIIDGGIVGPDHLPAHAHADLFSFELSVAGLPFVVDTGVYEYAAGSMRDYVRATAAHNTVTIDGASQAEVWGSFRVSRRYRPRDVSFRQHGSRSRFEGAFDGWGRLIGDALVHRRVFEVDGEQRRIDVVDTIEGREVHRIESRLHLHPGVTVTPDAGGFMLARSGMVCRVETEGGAAAVEESWYCPRFGVRLPRPVLVLRAEAPLPATLAFRLRYAPTAPDAARAGSEKTIQTPEVPFRVAPAIRPEER